jgi:hypothetical protein
MAEVFEHVTVEVLGVVDRDLLWDVVATYNILLEEVFDNCGGYVGDGLRLNLFREVLLANFTSCYQFCYVINHCWPIESLPEDFDG